MIITILLALSAVGCSDSKAPTIEVARQYSWSIPPDDGRIPAPRSVTISDLDHVLLLDTAGRVLWYNQDGKLMKQWRMPMTEAGRPEGIQMLRDGRIAVCDTHYHQILIFTPDGEIVEKWGKEGKGPGEFIYPIAITQDDEENIYIAEYGSNDRVQKFSIKGDHLLTFGFFGTGPGGFQRPSGMAWHNQKVYVADAINNRIQVFTDDGKHEGLLSPAEKPVTLRFPYDIAVAPDNTLFVVEYTAGRVTQMDLSGKLLGRYGQTGANDGNLRTPWGLAVDSKMRLRIADTGNRRMVGLDL